MINATLFGEMITFGIFGWFTMRFVMPQVNSALDDRENKIAAGLRDGEEGQAKLQKAIVESEAIIKEAKGKSLEIVKDGKNQASKILAQAEEEAKRLVARKLDLASNEIEQQRQQAEQELKADLSGLIIDATSKLLAGKVDSECNHKMLQDLLTESEG